MFKVGDKVRVKEGIREPRHAWGRVRPGEVGEIIRINNQNIFFVDFPSQKNWHAFGPDMEVVPIKPVYTAKDIRNRPVYKQLKASAADAKTLTKLVKLYLKTFNESPFGHNRDFEHRTAGIINSFGWLEENNEILWVRVHNGLAITFNQLPNRPKAKKIVKEDVAPAIPPLPPAPVEQPAVVGKGERPEGATHWHPVVERWIKVDAAGVVSFWMRDEKVWFEYKSQDVGRGRVANAIKLEGVPIPPAAEPVPAIQAAKANKVAPPKRIGWWG